MIRFGTTLFEEPGCNHLPAVLEALDESGIRARIGPWTPDQALARRAAPTSPNWLAMDADTALTRLSDGIDTVRKFGRPRLRDAVTIEGVGHLLGRPHQGRRRPRQGPSRACFLCRKLTSENEVALELAQFGERPVAHMAHHRRPARPRPAQPHDEPRR